MRKLTLACILAACGILAAFSVARASGPVTIPDLPGLGYSLSMQFNAGTQCGNYVVVSGNGVDREILIGDLPPRCSTADQEAQRIASLLNEFPPPGTAPVTTTVWATTTETVTLPAITEPAVTVYTPTVTLPAVTVASTPFVQTETVTVTETVTGPTVTVAAPAVDPAWLTALAARSQGMNDVYGLA